MFYICNKGKIRVTWFIKYLMIQNTYINNYNYEKQIY